MKRPVRVPGALLVPLLGSPFPKSSNASCLTSRESLMALLPFTNRSNHKSVSSGFASSHLNRRGPCPPLPGPHCGRALPAPSPVFLLYWAPSPLTTQEHLSAELGHPPPRQLPCPGEGVEEGWSGSYLVLRVCQAGSKKPWSLTTK